MRLALTWRSWSTVWWRAEARVLPGRTTTMTASMVGARTAESVTARVGGVSRRMTSADWRMEVRMPCIRFEPRSSAGLGGKDPVVMTERPSTRVYWRVPLRVSWTWEKRSDMPRRLARPK